VLRERPGLAGHVSIDEQMPNKSGLLAWLCARAAVVQKLDISSQSEFTSQCFTALKHPSSVLTSVKLRADSMASLHGLATFTSVTSCNLEDNHGDDYLDLTRMSLRGKFTSLSAASYLAHLDLQAASVLNDENCSFVSTLVELRLYHSCMDQLHVMGLAA